MTERFSNFSFQCPVGLAGYFSLSAFTLLIRRHARHQRAIAEWRTTPSHNKTPTNPKPTPAEARIAKAARLYSNIAATSPVAARLFTSRHASQQATPRVISAAPVSRPTINAAGASSDEPNRSLTAADGNTTNTNPAPASITAVRISRFFIVGPFLRLSGLPRLSTGKDVGGTCRPAGCGWIHIKQHEFLIDIDKNWLWNKVTIGRWWLSVNKKSAARYRQWLSGHKTMSFN